MTKCGYIGCSLHPYCENYLPPCASHTDQQEHDRKIREAVMDEFGILHGEDARRFNEYMENDDKNSGTPEGRKLIKEAYEFANKILPSNKKDDKLVNLVEWIKQKRENAYAVSQTDLFWIARSRMNERIQTLDELLKEIEGTECRN